MTTCRILLERGPTMKGRASKRIGKSSVERQPQPLFVKLAKSRMDQRATMAAMGEPGEDIDRSWFRMKFRDDLTDLRPENASYYKHYVHRFVTDWFTSARVAGKRVLDFGCGPGFYSAILCQRGAIVTGIDRSPFLIDKARQHTARLGLQNIEFVVGDFISYYSKFPPNTFDYVIAIDTIVSFDYDRTSHDHERVSKAFGGVRHVLTESGSFFIIESHPFFGQVFREIPTDTGEAFCLRSSNYKIEYRLKSDIHHWFTLSEMTRATSENGLAVFRIYEPDPAPALQRENPAAYAFRLKYPSMIVYEIRRMQTA